jgi:dTDP-4-amino-4,6-dideoxygalactose transaminase
LRRLKPGAVAPIYQIVRMRPSVSASGRPAPVAPRPGEPVRFQHPQLPPAEEVLAYFRRSEAAGWYSNGGPCAQELSSRLGAALGGATFVVPVANCTVGLIAALRAVCGAPAGARREILTPSFTFTATACAIHWAGFEPVFVDVDPDAWCLEPDALENALRARAGRVAGVLACAPFGTAPPVATRAAWRAACERHGVPLLLDSAPGFGAEDEEGVPLGGQGDTEVFSFHATKPFAIGEGGAVVTGDAAIAAEVGQLINFGLEPETRVSAVPGLNGKMSELHAATALAMLDRFPAVLASRRALAEALARRLGASGARCQLGAHRSPWQFFQLVLPAGADRPAALAAADELGVAVRTLHDPPLHRQPAFAGCTRADALATTEALAARSLSLPLANTMPDEHLDRIAAVVAAAV